jgi:hypothetical protein
MMRVVLGINPSLMMDGTTPLNEIVARRLERDKIGVVNTPCVTSLYEFSRLYEGFPIVISDFYPLLGGSLDNQRRLYKIEKSALDRLKEIDGQRLEGLLRSYGTQHVYGGLWLMAAFGTRVVPLMASERMGSEQRRILMEKVTGRKPVPIPPDAPIEKFLGMVEDEVKQVANGLRTLPAPRTPVPATSASTYRA